MVERRPLGTVVTHLILIAGVAIIALPLYVGYVGSTLSFGQVTSVPMQMTPGTHLLENYKAVLTSGSTAGSKAPVGQMMWNSLVMALCIAIGKIAISLLSPTTFFLLVVNVVYAFFDTFAIVDAATSGGPVQATSILVFKVYQDGVQALDLSGSAAQSVILMAIVIALTVIQFRFVERKVNY